MHAKNILKRGFMQTGGGYPERVASPSQGNEN